MKTKHTPGPWEFNGCEDAMGCDCIAITSDNRPGYIAGIHTTPDAKLDEIDQGNARLIAAAPELLEALKGMMEWARRAQLKKPNSGPEILNALNAIAKADL